MRTPAMRGPATTWRYDALKRLVADERLPLMLVDLDVLERNTRRLADVAAEAGMTLRVASKSLRVPDLIRRVMEVGAPTIRGLMCFSAAEASLLHDSGFDDLLIAYPTVQTSDLDLLWELRRRGADVSLMIDSPAHVARLQTWWADRLGGGADQVHGGADRASGGADRASGGAGQVDGGDNQASGGDGPRLPVCIDVDMSYRPLRGLDPGLGPHLGVQRSPVRDLDGLRAVVNAVRGAPALRLRGVMGYEAQIAGLGEANPFTPLLNPVKRLFKARSTQNVAERRHAIRRFLDAEGFSGLLFNGGGTGSLGTTTREPWLTEVTAGSGFLQSHLFDYFDANRNEPACCFALQVTRVPEPGVITCHSGGFIASGEICPDKAPVVLVPAGLTPLGAEGFGEVQTPLRVPPSVHLDPGDPVFCRPAKAGEIAERFDEYLLVRDGKRVGRAKTYRGLGHCFY